MLGVKLAVNRDLWKRFIVPADRLPLLLPENRAQYNQKQNAAHAQHQQYFGCYLFYGMHTLRNIVPGETPSKPVMQLCAYIGAHVSGNGIGSAANLIRVGITGLRPPQPKG